MIFLLAGAVIANVLETTGAENISELLAQNSPHILAISGGAAFWRGDLHRRRTEFHLKAIADRRKISMPTFPDLIFICTLPFLLPALIVVWWLFFKK